MSKTRLGLFLLIISALVIGYISTTGFLDELLASQEPGLAGEATGEVTEHYSKLLRKHLQADQQAEDGSIIFLGDSITEGFKLRQISTNAVNFGISMDTTVGLMKRIPEYSSLKKASAVIVLIGVNDIYRFKRKPETIVQNYQILLDMLPGEMPVIFCDVLPVDERIKWHKVSNKKIFATNERLKVFALSNERVTYVSLYESMLDESKNLSTEYHGGDGVHLNNKGYQLLAEKISRALQSHGVNLKK